MPSPMALSSKYLRDRGFAAEVVERWLRIPGKEIRRDLFRAIDIVAAHGPLGIILGVQTTSLANVSARVAKAKQQPGLKQWLQAGAKFEVHGWQLRNGRWVVKIVELAAMNMTELVTRSIPRRSRRPKQASLFDFEAMDLATTNTAT